MQKIKYILILLLFLAEGKLAAAQETGGQKDSSLERQIASYRAMPESDTAIVRLCYSIARSQGNVDSTIMWSERLLRLSRMHGMPDMTCEAYGFLTWAYYYKNEAMKCIELNNIGADLADSIGNIGLKAYFMYIMGYNYFSLMDFRQADKSYNLALGLYAEISDTSGIVDTYRAMASNFAGHRAYALSQECLHSAIQMARAIGAADKEALCLCNIAENNLYLYCESLPGNDVENVMEAKKVAFQALEMESSDYGMKCKAICAAIRSMFYEAMRQNYAGERRGRLLDSIRSCCMDGFRMASSFGGNCEFKTLMDIFHADYFICCRQSEKSRQLLDSIEGAAALTNECRQELVLSNYYYSIMQQDYRSALKYSQQYLGGILSQTSVDFAVEASQEFEQKKYAQQELQRAMNAQSTRHRVVIVAVIAGLVLIFLAIAFGWVRHYNSILSESNQELNKRNENITSSLTYASLIQKTVLPREEDLREIFSDCFLIFKPLNIVSGDFFWISRIGGRHVIACADCTGHGVPGAFISILGITLLNEIMSLLPPDTNASAVLCELRPRLIKALGQNKDIRDQALAVSMEGIDISLIILDRASMRLDYAGAYRPLWMRKGGNFVQYRPDRMPIGRFVGPDRDFTNQTIEVEQGDILYMFSDGIVDQMGFDKFHKPLPFSQKRLADLLAEVSALPLSEQKFRIESSVEAWRNGYRQLDDILMMGLRI